jgi:hypothetical protein
MLVRKCDYCEKEIDGEPVGINISIASYPEAITTPLDFCKVCSSTRIDEVRLVFLRGMAETDPEKAACRS